jgi:ABC transport system ATP-binding/permease protein
MKPCPHCARPNAPENKFCERCGRSLDAIPVRPPTPSTDATILNAGPLLHQLSRKSQVRSARPLAELFGGKTRVVVGRSSDCDVLLAHPAVSRRHAELERLPDGRLILRDLESSNGVFIDGRRLEEPTEVRERERVGIGPFLFSLDKGVVYSFDSSQSLRLQARAVEKVVTSPEGKKVKLLDEVELTVEPGEFVTLLGPSGSGKSTLMDCLNGRRRATGGRVLANGEDFYRYFDNFRQSLGYVPQKDIVHAHLTVERALAYTAQLRLPTDTSPAELKKRVEEVLEQMELTHRRENGVGTLSGGQIKRLCLGAELLAQPCLLFIDEATSGLDAGTDARMMKLFRKLADEGKSVVCITHNVENVESCHLVLVLVRGKVAYYGPPEDALPYFDVNRISAVYDRLSEQDPETWQKKFLDSRLHEEYVAKRAAADSHREPVAAAANGGGKPAPAVVADPAVSGPVALPSSGKSSIIVPPPPSVPRPHRPPLWHQFRVLTARYTELLWRDKRSLQLLFLQAPVIGAIFLIPFVGLSFTEPIPKTRKLEQPEKDVLRVLQGRLDQLNEQGEPPKEVLAQLRAKTFKDDNGNVLKRKDGQPLNGEDVYRQLGALRDKKVLEALVNAKVPIVPTGEELTNPKSSYMLLAILAIVVFWLGCNNSAKEIVKEEAIYGRERAVNLGIVPYLGSKFLVLGVISAMQVFLLMLVIYGSLHLWHLAKSNTWEVLPPEYALGYLAQYEVLLLLALTGVGVGLLISACVSSPDRASVLLPYVLIPQILLGGSMIPVNTVGSHLLAATICPVYWAYRAIHLGASTLPEGFPAKVEYPDSMGWPCGALALQLVVVLALTGFFLRRKDAGSDFSDWLTPVGEWLRSWSARRKPAAAAE